MGDEATSLTAAIDRLVRRARAARRVRWSGRVLLLSALVLLALFVLRTLLRAYTGTELLPDETLPLVAIGAGFVALAFGVMELALRLTNPGRLRVARHLDRRGRLRDLVTAGLTAVRLEGPIPAEVARRAARSISEFKPSAIYPVRRSGAKLLAVLPLLLVAFYLLGLPPAGGPIPLIAEGGELPGGESPTAPTEEGVEPSVEPEVFVPEDEPGESEPEAEAGPPDEVEVRIVPAKKRYKSDEPILLFVLANPGEHMANPHDLAVALALDGELYETEHEIRVEPGEGGKAVISIDGKMVEKMAEKLTSGKHRIAAVLAEGEVAAVSAEEEFEIEPGNSGGAGGAPPPPPEEEPQPEPPPDPQPEGPGETEPPPMDTEDRLVDPFVGDGDVEKKTGIALVPDENAPAGAPPRRLSLPEAAAEAGRRGGTGVPTERILAKDRDLVSKYFELLKDADAKKKPK